MFVLFQTNQQNIDLTNTVEVTYEEEKRLEKSIDVDNDKLKNNDEMKNEKKNAKTRII